MNALGLLPRAGVNRGRHYQQQHGEPPQTVSAGRCAHMSVALHPCIHSHSLVTGDLAPEPTIAIDRRYRHVSRRRQFRGCDEHRSCSGVVAAKRHYDHRTSRVTLHGDERVDTKDGRIVP